MATPDHCLYCFEVLTAHLEKRPSLPLEKVQELWTIYPKGLELTSSEEEDEEDINPQTIDSTSQIQSRRDPRPDPNANTNLARHPILQRITRSTSGTSTPSSSSSSERTSTSNSTSATTPSSSTTSFTPIGIAPSPRHTTQLPSSSPRNVRDWSSPLFVTWNTLSTSSHPHQNSPTLRGCIGTFSSEPLITSLPEYALTSALHDTRFSPISRSELPTLEVAVTLLTDFETCAHPLDWEIGVHGIRITFYHKNKRYGACYLPDVAVEQEWGREETVVSAMRKAGWGGRREKWREVGQLTVVRYQGRKESVSWKEYNEWRNWVKMLDEKNGGS
ncbi:hypothetical protein SS1G_11727 [Sclerotinia sclerotiorum 1980 UF-70]|uniref:AMMECR1 domain-containing protein n=2 Tax=Sclerotinia sclerotiorum (strain ATCC 18683 / 1980 / Ss-1) TaxID=665079 RepID=A7F381_SCLS1|nr:hypothetical protein SS1G_11727 [Sclerotinia sclerotiorum 1980 UF-70]APA14425.1 hypothetical protein sscle_12g091950 [Sclerotinia sclerotiorum 1980 UF-70]EDN97202.1 hypothetical protein SS1G_11727 [Sclerotinia sclerotiorum 1980 UF-70]